jgi:hypothetical protein
LSISFRNIAALTVLSLPIHEMGCFPNFVCPLSFLLTMLCSFQSMSFAILLFSLFLSGSLFFCYYI